MWILSLPWVQCIPLLCRHPLWPAALLLPSVSPAWEPLLLPPPAPSTCQMDGPASLFKSLLLDGAFSMLAPPSCWRPRGEAREEGMRSSSHSLGKSHPVWLPWFLGQLVFSASIWIVNPLPPAEEEKQALITSALVGGVWCFINDSVRSATHKTFWEERHLQDGVPRPSASLMIKLKEWCCSECLTDICSPVH